MDRRREYQVDANILCEPRSPNRGKQSEESDAFVRAVRLRCASDLESLCAKRDSKGAPLLEAMKTACEMGCLEAARILIQHGESPNEYDGDGWPVWHWTVDINKDEDKKFRNKFKCKNGRIMLSLTPMQGVQCDQCKRKIRTCEVYFYHCTFCREDRCFECVWKFQQAERQARETITGFGEGVKKTSMGLVSREVMMGYMLCHGAQINACDKEENNSALLWAVNRQQTETIWLLLHHGIDPTIENTSGYTAVDKRVNFAAQGEASLVFCCTMREHFKNKKLSSLKSTVALLKGKDSMSLGEECPSECAKILSIIMGLEDKKKRIFCLEFFRKVFWPEKAARRARDQPHENSIFGVGSGDSTLFTPLHIAAQMGYVEEAKILLEMGAPANIISMDIERHNFTPLMLVCGAELVVVEERKRAHALNNLERIHKSRKAVFNNFSEIAKVLIAHKADVTMKDKQGNNLLHWAVKSGRRTVVRTLFQLHQRGAISLEVCDSPNEFGNRPVHYATYHAHQSGTRLEILRILLEFSDPHRLNSNMQQPSVLVTHAPSLRARRVRSLLKRTNGFQQGLPAEDDLKDAAYDLCFDAKQHEETVYEWQQKGSDRSRTKALDSRTCFLCGRLIYGVRWLIVYEYLNKEFSFHLPCLLYTPEVKWTGDRIQGIAKAIRRGRAGKLRCYVCQEPKALIGCSGGSSLGGKQKTFHYPCGVKYKLKFVHADDHSWQAAFCNDHSSHDHTKGIQEYLLSSSEDDSNGDGEAYGAESSGDIELQYTRTACNQLRKGLTSFASGSTSSDASTPGSVAVKSPKYQIQLASCGNKQANMIDTREIIHLDSGNANGEGVHTAKKRRVFIDLTTFEEPQDSDIELLSERSLLRDLSGGREMKPVRVRGELRILGNFEYITNNTFSARIPQLQSLSSRPCKGCTCQGNCGENKSCECRKRYVETDGRFPFSRQHRLGNVNEVNKIYLCHEGCSCNATCMNRVESKVRYEVEVFNTKYKGWACRSLQNIDQGEFVMEYVGEVVEDDDKKAREFTYLFSVGESVNIDPVNKGNVARFMNHSCTPNLHGVRSVLPNIAEKTYHRVMFFANQKIIQGQELNISYGYEKARVPGICLPCRCYSPGCKQILI